MFPFRPISWALLLLLFAVRGESLRRRWHHRRHSEPDPLLVAWSNFTHLQRSQSMEVNREFPVDERLYASLRKCGHFEIAGEHASDTLQPKDVELYAEIGHLTTFCRVDLSLAPVGGGNASTTLDMTWVVETLRTHCLESIHTKSKNPTLAKVLGVIGARVQVMESNVVHKNLQAWTRHIVHMIEKVPDYRLKWKLLVLAPGLFDLPAGTQTHKLAHHVLQSIQLIKHRLPERTLVVVVRNSLRTFWHHLSEHFVFCRKIHDLWPTHEGKSEEVWNILEERLKKNFRSDQFYAHVLPFIEESRPLKLGKTYDVSVVSPDCVHFSSRGLSLLHVHLWNWLVQPARQTEWTPLVRPLYCPRPGCPYFVTKTNTYFCPQAKRIDPQEKENDPSDVLILTMLLVTTVFYALLLAYMTCL